MLVNLLVASAGSLQIVVAIQDIVMSLVVVAAIVKLVTVAALLAIVVLGLVLAVVVRSVDNQMLYNYIHT